MKKIITLFMLLLMHMPVYAQDNVSKDFMIVETKSGKRISFRLETRPELSFEPEDVVIAADGSSFRYPVYDMAKIRFASSSGVSGLNVDLQDFELRDNTLSCGGLESGQCIRLFDTSGVCVVSATASPSGHCDIDLSSLLQGVYVVSTGNISFKLIKK